MWGEERNFSSRLTHCLQATHEVSRNDCINRRILSRLAASPNPPQETDFGQLNVYQCWLGIRIYDLYIDVHKYRTALLYVYAEWDGGGSSRVRNLNLMHDVFASRTGRALCK